MTVARVIRSWTGTSTTSATVSTRRLACSCRLSVSLSAGHMSSDSRRSAACGSSKASVSAGRHVPSTVKVSTMTTTPFSPEGYQRLVEWMGPVAGPLLYNYLATAKHRTEAPCWPDVEDLIPKVVELRFRSPVPDIEGAWFDVAAVDKFIRFCRLLPHIKGKW